MSRLYFFILIIAGLASAVIISAAWEYTRSEIRQLHIASQPPSLPSADTEVLLKKKQMKPHPERAKGLYLTASSAGNPKKIDEIIDLIGRTELNAVVIDIKDYTGYILYDSQVPLVKELKFIRNQLGDARSLIKKLHEHNIYVIARQTVFQDQILALKKSEWAIQSTAGGVWRDRKGLSWVDPTRIEVWEYNVAVAKEAIDLGFDEINFDYVRFPTDGNMSQIVYKNGEEKLYDVMKKFYQYLNVELGADTAKLSLDFFGFVMERHDGMTIGQRLEDAVGKVHYISPMMYPSHYPKGHLGLENPAAHPAIVIDNGMKNGIPYVASSTTKIRPWIQAFNLGAVYDASKIRAQIDAVEKYPNAGWLLWNASNRYTEAGLKMN